jgi:hypothetical protein
MIVSGRARDGELHLVAGPDSETLGLAVEDTLTVQLELEGVL